MKKLLFVFLFIPCISLAQAAKDTTYEKTYLKQAYAAYSNKEYEKCIEDYTHAIKLNPQKPLYYTNRASAKWALKNYEDAVKDLDTAISLPGKYAWTYYNHIGLIKMDEKDNKGAIVAFTKAIDLHSDESDYNDRALAEIAIGNYRAAIKDLTITIKQMNTLKFRAFPGNYTFIANQYALRGKALLLNGDAKTAITDLDSAITINPKFAKAFNIRGEAKIKLGDKIGAFTDWQTASSMNFEPAKENLKKYADNN